MTTTRRYSLLLLLAAVAASACGSGGSSSPAGPTALAAPSLPAGYAAHTGPGFSIGLSGDWAIAAAPGDGIALKATNVVGGHSWLLVLAKTPDAKPAAQSFDDYAATQRAKCSGASPDTIVVPAGSAFICRADLADLSVLDYRLPVGRDVWSESLAFEDGKYSGTGQEEAETILRTLVLAP